MTKYYCRDNKGRFSRPTVATLPKNNCLMFVCDSQDTNQIKDYLGSLAADYDSFFVIVGQGDYDAIWGMVGSVPYWHKVLDRLV